MHYQGPARVSIKEAEYMMGRLSTSDVASLKKVSKVTPDYEFYSQLFLTLIN